MQVESISEKNWQELKSTIDGIFVQPDAIEKIKWQHSFLLVNSLCNSSEWRQKIYKSVNESFIDHVNNVMKKMSESDLVSSEFLAMFNSEWKNFSQKANWTNLLLNYLNKKMRKNTEAKDVFQAQADLASRVALMSVCIEDMALEIWESHFISDSVLLDKVTANFLAMMASDRLQNIGDSSDVASTTSNLFVKIHSSEQDIFSYYDLYKRCIEKPVLSMIQEKCESLACNEYLGLGSSDFISQVRKVVEDEKSRAIRFLHNSSVAEVEHTCLLVFVDYELKRFRDAAPTYIYDNDTEGLRNMYLLLKPRNLVQCLEVPLHNAVQKSATDMLISNIGDDPFKAIPAFRQIHVKYSDLVVEVFQKDEKLVAAMDKALQMVVNSSAEQTSKMIRFLNRYLDSLMKWNKMKTAPVSSAKPKMSKAIDLLDYVNDKETFREVYSGSLAIRLLANQSASLDVEKAMIEMFRSKCGFDYTRNMVMMIKDIEQSHKLRDRFPEGRIENQTKVNVKVLRTGSWPASLSTTGLSSVVLPISMQNLVQTFETFYKDAHNRSKLTWLHALGTVDIGLNYLDKPYLMEVNLQQFSVLMAFSETDEHSIKEISEVVGQTIADTAVAVKLFISSKLLLCDGDVSNLDASLSNEATKIRLNLDFSNEQENIKLPV